MAEGDPSRLIAALADIERHVSELGWDQPARLFALVDTATLLELSRSCAGESHKPRRMHSPPWSRRTSSSAVT